MQNFIAKILAQDQKAHVITAGDFNDYAQVQPLQVFAQKSGLVDMDDAANIDAQERYTYVFDQNSQALDHMYVSRAAARGAQFEHLHLNSWVPQEAADERPRPERGQAESVWVLIGGKSRGNERG